MWTKACLERPFSRLNPQDFFQGAGGSGGRAAGRGRRRALICQPNAQAAKPQDRPPKPVGPFGYACAPLYASEHVKQRTLGHGTHGALIDLDVPLSPPLTRKQRTRALTRSNLTVYLIQTRLPDSTAKRECRAGSAEGSRSINTTKRSASKRHKLQESYRGKDNSLEFTWQQVLRVKVPEAALSELASAS
jgi:hypothetical protein